jgi:hypothetical protein
MHNILRVEENKKSVIQITRMRMQRKEISSLGLLLQKAASVFFNFSLQRHKKAFFLCFSGESIFNAS